MADHDAYTQRVPGRDEDGDQTAFVWLITDGEVEEFCEFRHFEAHLDAAYFVESWFESKMYTLEERMALEVHRENIDRAEHGAPLIPYTEVPPF